MRDVLDHSGFCLVDDKAGIDVELNGADDGIEDQVRDCEGVGVAAEDGILEISVICLPNIDY